MMTEISLSNTGDLQTMDTATLRQALGRSLELTAKHINYLATIWRELESRGEDLSDLRHGLAAYLPLIANARLDANILVQYAGQKTLLGALANLPIHEQRRIAESGYITVVRLDDTGGRQELKMPLTRLPSAEIYRVFSETGIRPPDEQYRLLVARGVRKQSPPRKSRRILVDDARGVLIVSNTAADLDRVVDALSAHYGVDIAGFINK